MDETSIHKLEFDAIRETLAGHCGSQLGKGLALSLSPVTNPQTVRHWLDQVKELTAVSQEHALPPMGGVHDIREHVRAAAFPAPLEADVLVRVAETLQATETLRNWLNQVGAAAPSLQSLGRRVSDLSPIAALIRDAIDERGHIHDHATPRLATIRRAIEDAKGRIRSVFDRILRQSSQTRMLQYGAATFHNDRYVLPLKAEHRGRIQGIIHRSSESGATLFVEPAESVELNNTIVRLRDEENKEITQILRGLTQHVHGATQVIVETLGAIAVLDLVSGKCRYAKKRVCVCPAISDDGKLELYEARHPLLIELFAQEEDDGGKERQVVPIDIRLGDDFDVLIITGPNTGGKTVTLKTIGLLALMTQCGVPIPVGEGSTMPVYKKIFVDVGDEQSIHQSLSTFSSHLATLLTIIRGSGPGSLVLIDELGAGTDPDEGAAIGRAVITELLQLGATAVVTTHLSALKGVAFTTARVDNASVEFDVESLKPTFRIRLGEPGNSNALIIAERLGMPARLIRLAKGFLDDRARVLSKAIAGTLASRREAEAARKTAREAILQAQRERDLYEREKRELEESQEAFSRWTQWVNALRAGDEVFVRPLNRPGKVVRMQLQQQTVLVSAGAMDLEVGLRDIEMPRADD